MAEHEALERYVDRELSLRAEKKNLEGEGEKLKKQLKKLKAQENLLQLEVERGSEDKSLTIFLQDKVRTLQSELVDHKQRTYELIENQKKWLILLYDDVNIILSENEELKKQLRDKETNLSIITEKYKKMMNTKTMKWTGKYWNLLKKIN
jgi:hypothetical protein